MVTVGDDHVTASAVSNQKKRRERLTGFNFFPVLFDVEIANAQKRQT